MLKEERGIFFNLISKQGELSVQTLEQRFNQSQAKAEALKNAGLE